MLSYYKTQIVLVHCHFDFSICFRIGINEPKNFFDMSQMTELMPGHTNYFIVKAIATIADEGIKEKLSPHQRNCRFSDEMPPNMTLFKNYSKAACMFECLIMIRYDILFMIYGYTIICFYFLSALKNVNAYLGI